MYILSYFGYCGRHQCFAIYMFFMFFFLNTYLLDVISVLVSLVKLSAQLFMLFYQDRALPFQWSEDIPWKGHQVYSLRLPGALG